MDTLEVPKPVAYVIDLVPPQYLEATWPHVVGWISSFVERSRGRCTLESVAKRFASNEWRLWVISHGKTLDGCVITRVYEADSGMRLCEILACIGSDASQWVHLRSEVEAWAAQNGCHRVQMWARKGWGKHVPEYQQTHVLLEKDLR